MNNLETCLVRGVMRLCVWALSLAVVFIAFNLLGRLFVNQDLVFWTDMAKARVLESYWGHATLLAFAGLTQTVLCLGATAVLGLVLTAIYDVILYFGGYRARAHKT